MEPHLSRCIFPRFGRLIIDVPFEEASATESKSEFILLVVGDAPPRPLYSFGARSGDKFLPQASHSPKGSNNTTFGAGNLTIGLIWNLNCLIGARWDD